MCADGLPLSDMIRYPERRRRAGRLSVARDCHSISRALTKSGTARGGTDEAVLSPLPQRTEGEICDNPINLACFAIAPKR